MWTRGSSFTVLAVCLAIGASACGGGNSDESSGTSAGVIGQVESICDDWRDSLAERGDFPVEDFDPENPSPEDLPAVGDYFSSGHVAAERAIAELRDLSPPADLDASVQALVSALEQQLASGREQASAARAGDVTGFSATLEDAASSQEATAQAADQLGTPSCAL